MSEQGRRESTDIGGYTVKSKYTVNTVKVSTFKPEKAVFFQPHIPLCYMMSFCNVKVKDVKSFGKLWS